jgi:predicted RNA-binding Zn-ribbon protein involved in translation (DUF1610 family)
MAEQNTSPKKHYVRLAAISGNSETAPVFFRCPNCGNGIPFSESAQQRLVQGGVGHRCPNCERYVALVVGSCCDDLFAVDDVKWDQLVKERPVDCPNCGTGLYLPQRAEISLGVSCRESSTLCCFTESAHEAAFIEAAKLVLPAGSQDLLAIYHHTTHERLSLAAAHLEALKNHALTSSWAIYNNPGLEEAHAKEVAFSASVLPNAVFQITSSVFSAIESLAQETNIMIGAPWHEDKVSYRFFEKIPLEPNKISECCTDFVRQPNFVFLRNLRNLSLHRRITILATMAIFTLPAYQSIRPSSVHPDCIHYLPDNPLVPPGKETFENKREVKSTLRLLRDESGGFVYELYGLLARWVLEGSQ